MSLANSWEQYTRIVELGVQNGRDATQLTRDAFYAGATAAVKQIVAEGVRDEEEGSPLLFELKAFMTEVETRILERKAKLKSCPSQE